MPLITCPDCSSQVSDAAPACPKCGRPIAPMKIEATATALRATKANAGDAKIDPIMAVFDAVDVMVANPDPKMAPAYQLFFA